MDTSKPLKENDYISSTRAYKNLMKLKDLAPQLFSEANKKDFMKIAPFDLIKSLHTKNGRERTLAHPELSFLMRKFPLLNESKPNFDNLFNGTFYIVQMNCTISYENNALLWVSEFAINNILNYTHLAIQPISLLAGQYGKNKVAVHPTVLNFELTLPNRYFETNDVHQWCNEIAFQYHLDASTSCPIFIIPYGIWNIDQPLIPGGGYHGSNNGMPFIVANVTDEIYPDFTVQDPEKRFSDTVSHEIAETIVDPMASWDHPEVCDACSRNNCNNGYHLYFDDNLQYIDTLPWRGLSGDIPFQYKFSIAAVCKPEFSHLLHPGEGCLPPGDISELACKYKFPDQRQIHWPNYFPQHGTNPETF